METIKKIENRQKKYNPHYCETYKVIVKNYFDPSLHCEHDFFCLIKSRFLFLFFKVFKGFTNLIFIAHI